MSLSLVYTIYPWYRPGSLDPAGVASNHHPHHQRVDWRVVLGNDVLSLPRTWACFEQIEADPLLGYRLPKKPTMLPGQILKHCYDVVDNVLESQYPCIYKVGLTHDAHFRFYNQKFGYRYERDKWEKMLVLHAASESISPGFIEAAIIQRHKGFLIAKGNEFNVAYIVNCYMYIYIITSNCIKPCSCMFLI